MFDIGWPELLVVAIVLIIVVGPKDLPPMLRAFGRTTKKLRSMANEFRGQFDEALREAELDDVKKSLDDARKLNPMQTIRDAVNPLKDTAKSVRSDIEKSVNAPIANAAVAPQVPPAKTDIPEATMKLPDGPPEVKADPAVGTGASAPAKPAAASDQASGAKASKPAAASKPKAATAKGAAKPDLPKSGPAKAPAQKPASKLAAPKTAAAKPAAPKTAAAKPAASAKPTAAKPAPRAREPKQGEDKA